MSFKDDPAILTIPTDTKFPTTDYDHKRRMAQLWVRKRHPDGPVAVYVRTYDPPKPVDLDLRGFLIPETEGTPEAWAKRSKFAEAWAKWAEGDSHE